MPPVERDELEFLATASRILGASLDYQTTLAQIAELVVPGLADHCALYVLEPSGCVRQVGDASVDAVSATALHALRNRQIARDRAGAVGEVIRTGKAVRFDAPFADETAHDDATSLAAIVRAHPATIAALPLTTRGHVLGALLLGASRERPFGERSARLATELADRAAQALDNAWLYRETRSAAMRLEALAEASRVFAEAGLDSRAAYTAIVQFVGDFLSDSCILALTTPDGTALEVVALHHPVERTRQLLAEMYARPQSVNQGLLGHVVRTGEMLLVPVIDLPTMLEDPRPAVKRFVTEAQPHSLVIVPLRRGGRVIGTLAVGRDRPGVPYDEDDARLLTDLADRAGLVVENARLYREAQEANRVKDEFLGTVSHELRTPLTSILGWIWMLRSGRVDSAGVPRAIATIERNAQAQAQLIDDLLDVSRIVAGKLQINVQRVDLAALVSAAVESMRPMAETRRLELHTTIEPVVVRGDPQRLQQITLNLLSNALKFTPEGGRVTVEVSTKGDGPSRAIVTVKDTGRGIPLDFLPFVFDRFRQADASATRMHGGLGLGLAIARHLVELHGGAIRVESEGPGRGATFTLSLPTGVQERASRTSDTVAPVAFRAAGATAVLGGVRVLVVEDEVDTRDMLLAALRGEGAVATGVGSARAALDALTNDRPDILLSDIGMAGEDGYALVRSLRAMTDRALARTPAVALTAYARPEDSALARDAGFDEQLTKPVDPGRLARVLADLVRDRSRVQPARG